MSRRIQAPEPPPLRRPPFNFAAVDEARALAARAERLHREADEIVVPWSEQVVTDDDGRVLFRQVVHEARSPEAQRAASLRRTACALELDAERLVPVEYRG